ncbi:MAG TPA: peptidase [Thermoguttaceae bacterium]|nr:peptidase [Thermoguttaceae bacterium]
MFARDFLLRSRIPARWVIGLLLAAIWLSGPATVRAGEDAPKKKYSLAVLIRFEGPITPLLEHFVYRKLDIAQQRKADLVIVEINSPGGLLNESLAIADRLRQIDWARTVAYIPEYQEAISGAAIAALGCDDIIMHPDSLFGDAAPIIEGKNSQFEHAPEKIRRYLVERVRILAEDKGRPAALVETMVDYEREVYRVRNRNTGEEKFMTDREFEAQGDAGPWEKIGEVVEAAGGDVFTVSGTRAVELGLAEGTAADFDELKQRYGISDEDIIILKRTGIDTAVSILNAPLVTGLLFVVGLIALYIEFSAPGIGLGGLIAVLCFSIFFWSRFLGGTADLLDVILFVSGIMFLAVEIFVLPGFGIAGLTGLILLAASLVMASHTFIVPHTPRELSELTYTLLVVFLSGGAFVVAAMVLGKHFGSFPLFNRLALQPPAPERGGEDGSEGIDASGRPNLRVGDCGVAESVLRPAGKARFGDRYADVVTEGEFIIKGRPIKIAEIHGNRVVVEEIEGTG